MARKASHEGGLGLEQNATKETKTTARAIFQPGKAVFLFCVSATLRETNPRHDGLRLTFATRSIIPAFAERERVGDGDLRLPIHALTSALGVVPEHVLRALLMRDDGEA